MAQRPAAAKLCLVTAERQAAEPDPAPCVELAAAARPGWVELGPPAGGQQEAEPVVEPLAALVVSFQLWLQVLLPLLLLSLLLRRLQAATTASLNQRL